MVIVYRFHFLQIPLFSDPSRSVCGGARLGLLIFAVLWGVLEMVKFRGIRCLHVELRQLSRNMDRILLLLHWFL